MIGLFFEVETRPGHRDQYLDLAAALKPALEATGGCLLVRNGTGASRGKTCCCPIRSGRTRGRSRLGGSMASTTRCRSSAASASLPITASALPR